MNDIGSLWRVTHGLQFESSISALSGWDNCSQNLEVLAGDIIMKVGKFRIIDGDVLLIARYGGLVGVESWWREWCERLA